MMDGVLGPPMQQVATDMRLWLRDRAKEILARLYQLLEVVATRATNDIDILMPGYTHLQVRTAREATSDCLTGSCAHPPASA